MCADGGPWALGDWDMSLPMISFTVKRKKTHKKTLITTYICFVEALFTFYTLHISFHQRAVLFHPEFLTRRKAQTQTAKSSKWKNSNRLAKLKDTKPWL